ncbi:hypothetical protein BKA70DRAFT_1223218 [Coprinopsis sp. MPI-PUGE-AT-0042]|nr:hypothetical protein BKA70DRAFT_1223218 [Coprinopsis sp. MPI-PUGE-AT-0042]
MPVNTYLNLRPIQLGAPPRLAIEYTPTLRTIKGIFFNASARDQPNFQPVPTLANPAGGDRFPCVEAVFGTHSRLHECAIDVVGAGERDLGQYVIWCQAEEPLQVNHSIIRLDPTVVWTGSLLILKRGRNASFISMTSSDKPMALDAVKEFLAVAKDLGVARGGKLPNYLSLVPL